MGAGLGIRGLRQVSVTVRDVDRATAFYRDVLGLAHLFSVPGAAFFDCGGVRLYLAMPEGEQLGSSVLYLQVDDIEASWAALEAGAVELERGPQLTAQLEDHDLWLAFFRDTEDNLLALLSEVAREAGEGRSGSSHR